MSDNNLTIKKDVLVAPPSEIMAAGKQAAQELMNVVTKNNWAVIIQGKKYLVYEAWATVGKFFGYTVKTEWSKYVEYGDVKGFESRVVVIDKDGKEIGGAEGICMNDEARWRTEPHADKYGKTVAGTPLYALKSMSQTRAAGRALRQVLSWVVVLAGYAPTTKEEMTDIPGVEVPATTEDDRREEILDSLDQNLATPPQKKKIFALGKELGYEAEDTKKIVKVYFKIESFNNLTKDQAKRVIDNLQKKVEEAEIKESMDATNSENNAK